MWPFRKVQRVPEVNSGEPVEIPTRLRLSGDDKIRQMIRHELFRQAAGQEGMESFEEADDFELGEGDEWVSPYEDGFDPDFDSPAEPTKDPEPAPAPAPSQPVKSNENEPSKPTSP